MSPRACSSLVPVNSVGPGWTSSTSQEALPWSSRRACSSGSNLAIASATSRSTVIAPSRCVGEPVVDPPRRVQRELVGVLGGPAGLPRRDLSACTRRHSRGRRWRSRTSANSRAPAAGDMPMRGRERLRGERRDRRRPVPTQRLVQIQHARQGGVGVVGGHPGLGGGRMQDAPLHGQLQPHATRPPGLPVRWPPRPRAPCPGRGRPPCSWHQLNHRPPTPRWPRTLIHKGFRHRDRFVMRSFGRHHSGQPQATARAKQPASGQWNHGGR